MAEVRLPKARGTLSPRGAGPSLRKAASVLPFEKLPNLPSPIIPVIDLGIGSRTDIKAIEAPTKPISGQKRIGFSVSDGTTQTDASCIVEVKDVTRVIETLLQDVAQLRKDLNFAQNVLKVDYENKLNRRAAELYCRVNDKTSEIEKHHKEKLEIVRRSYHQQLINAIQKIAGEYKAYYDELMSGKTGRHDLKIKDLKEKVIEQERLLEVQALRVEELMTQISQLEGKEHEEEPSYTGPSISQEEMERLQETIADLQTELTDTRTLLRTKEEAEKSLKQQLNTTTKDLETERGKVTQLKRDMEGLKKKSKAEQEKAARLAESQRASLEKETRERVEKAQNNAALQAQHDTEQLRMREQAALELERERSHRREEELRAQQSSVQPQAMGESELEAELAKLQLAGTRQREEIARLQKELERVNRVWSTKLAIMQKNFHALRDECFLRSSLQRQAATLHHATLGYAVDGYHTSKQNAATSRSEADVIHMHSPQSTDMECNGDKTCLRMQDDRLSVPPPPPTPTPREFRSPSRNVHLQDRSNSSGKHNTHPDGTISTPSCTPVHS